MSAIDDAVARLQELALLSSSDIKSAPAYPVSDATVLPLSIAHLRDGSSAGGEQTFMPFIHNVGVDFHVSRISLKNAYTQLDTIVPSYIALLSGDPTLDDTIDSINLDEISYTIQPAQWDTITTIAAFFTVPIKIIVTPSTSS